MNPYLKLWIDRLHFLLTILIVVALGFYIVHAFLDYKYKITFLQSPCNLCAELNKNQSACIAGCFTNRITLYPDGSGGWRDPNQIKNLNINFSIIP